MTTTAIQQTRGIVYRAVKNYPSVVKDILKELQNQGLKYLKQTFDLLRLIVKTVGIVSFPLWILPVALVMCFTIYVLNIHTNLTELTAKN